MLDSWGRHCRRARCCYTLALLLTACLLTACLRVHTTGAELGEVGAREEAELLPGRPAPPRFQERLQARRFEVEELIRNISASMSANPLVREIQASRRAARPGPVQYPGHKVERGDASWQPVTGTTHRFYVYSAYCDTRDPAPLVRVVAATRTKKSDKVRPAASIDTRLAETRKHEYRNSAPIDF